MLHLPFPPSIIRLKSFWLVVSVSTALLAACLVQILTSRSLPELWAVIAISLAIPVFLRPNIALVPYRAWNKLVNLAARCVAQVLLLMVFTIITIGVGRKVSCLHLEKPKDWSSMWIPKSPNDSRNLNTKGGVSTMNIPEGSVFAEAVRWAIQSGNWWMCSLVPCIALISALEKDQEMPEVSANVYTLY